MASRKQKGAATVAAPLFTPVGTFFVLTATDVSVHVIGEGRLAGYFDGLQILEGIREDRQQMYREQLTRETFRVSGAVMALPAPSVAAMLWYAETYDGPLADLVRGLAACHVTGTTYSADKGGGDGGQPAKLEPLSPAPASPGGAVFADMVGAA